MIDDKTLYKDFLKGSIEAFETLVINHKDSYKARRKLYI